MACLSSATIAYYFANSSSTSKSLSALSANNFTTLVAHYYYAARSYTTSRFRFSIESCSMGTPENDVNSGAKPSSICIIMFLLLINI